MKDGEMQDLAHRVRGLAHYGLQHFKESVRMGVELGRMLAEHPEVGDSLFAGEESGKAKIFVEMSRNLAGCESFTEEKWRELDEQHTEAMVKWLVALDKRKRPRDRRRARQLLRKNVMAGSALMTLFAGREP